MYICYVGLYDRDQVPIETDGFKALHTKCFSWSSVGLLTSVGGTLAQDIGGVSHHGRETRARGL